jgi:hypothetical protein
MHLDMTGVLGLTQGGMTGLYATSSGYSIYVQGYMAQQRVLAAKDRIPIWDTTFHKDYMNMIYGLLDTADSYTDTYTKQLQQMPLNRACRFDGAQGAWIDSGIPYQESYSGGDFHNLFILSANPIYPKRTDLVSLKKRGLFPDWTWWGAGGTAQDSKTLRWCGLLMIFG